jgi:hypothetical protein
MVDLSESLQIHHELLNHLLEIDDSTLLARES